MKRFLSTFGICLALVEAFLFFGGYQLFDFSRRWYLAGASIALVLAVLVCILVHQNDRLEALEKRTRERYALRTQLTYSEGQEQETARDGAFLI